MQIEVGAEIHSSDIASAMSRAYEMTRDDYAGLLEFILEIDEGVCDLQFTIALRDKLSEVIAECQEED